MSPPPSTPAETPPRARADLGLATYRLLLGAYPPAFRTAYGREMAQLFRDQRRAAAGAADGGRPALGFWAAVVWDVVRSAPALRLDALRNTLRDAVRAWRRDRATDRRRGPWARGPRPNHVQPEGGAMTARRTVAVLAAAGGLFELANTGAEVRAGYGGPMGGWALGMALSLLMGALLLTSGVALLRGGPGGTRLARGAALACLALVVGLQVTFPFMSIFARLLGVGLPLALLLVARRGPGPSAPLVA